MLRLAIPGRGTCQIGHVVLDLNGTIALDGEVSSEIEGRLAALRPVVRVVIVTADAHGTAHSMAGRLGLELFVVSEGDEDRQKLDFVRRLGAEHIVAIGNGSNDAAMLKESAVGICVIGREGASTAALLSADIAVTDIRDALDLLIRQTRLQATLRT